MKLTFAYIFMLVVLAEGDIIVNTTHGPVQGGLISRDGIEYYAYQGIRYGHAQRFKAPEPVKPWNVTYDATSFKFSCYQLPKDPRVNESEDCLFLNVYTPKDTNLRNLPVMAYVHGGGFVSGDSWIDHFGPDYIVNRSVIVVTMNYRLGVFGFLSTGNMASPGNYGIKDVILGLKWTKDNCKSFGGNPDEVTVFGESGGGALVGYLVQSPKATGLFQRAVMMSGNNLCSWSYVPDPNQVAVQVGILVGCVALTSQGLVDCLRRVDADALRNASNTVMNLRVPILLYGIVNDQGYAPTMEPEHDGAVITSSNYQAFSSGNFNRVPLIIGESSEEALELISQIGLIRLLLLQADILRSLLVPRDMNAGSNSAAAGDEIARYYFNGSLLISSASDQQIVKYFSDNLFDRAVREIIRLTSQHAPVRYYRFSYFGKMGQFTSQAPGLGKAAHASILYYIWRINSPGYNNTDLSLYPPEDFRARDRLITLLTNYAKTGNPTPSSDPLLENKPWPLAYSNGNQTVSCYDIGDNITVLLNPEEEEYSKWRSIYSRYGNHDYITY